MKNTIKIFSLCLLALAFIACKKSGSENTNAEGEKTTATEEKSEKTSHEAVKYTVKNGVVNWVGSKPTGSKHTGTINVSGGELSVAGDFPVGGKFTIDMNSITNTDQEAGKGKEKLEGHLKSPGLF